jgi:predicted metal-binding protein
MQLQVVVDNQKKFTYIFVGMPNSMNHGCILRISSLYQQVMYGDTF